MIDAATVRNAALTAATISVTGAKHGMRIAMMHAGIVAMIGTTPAS